MGTRDTIQFIIKPAELSRKNIIEFFSKNPNIQFVSLFGVDIVGHDTDEKIPKNEFLGKLDAVLAGEPLLQTDGSSIALSSLAKLNDCKVDMVADTDATWYVDYNEENLDPATGRPVGTLRIPAFLLHNSTPIGSRSILKTGTQTFKKSLRGLLKESKEACAEFDPEDIETININIGTELEFWVRTPRLDAEIEALQTAQTMQENYWQRTKGVVRTALENSLILLEQYGLEPEMGHKEVGGVKAGIGRNGELHYVMEQIEVDWRYSSDPLEACDKELLARITIKETFRRYGLEVNFQAKPVENVAGNGEHIHLGLTADLKNGKTVNLFSPGGEKSYLSPVGYGSLMGILKNYDFISPFLSPTTDALNRLKPNFEAPVAAVCSLGRDFKEPSRNRTVLACLVSDLKNPLARRFEIRAANPHSNLYISLTAILGSMHEGIRYAIFNHKTEEELLRSLSKKPGDQDDYLEEGYAYRSEDNIFEDYSDDERERLFGSPPKTVYEVFQGLENFKGDDDSLMKEILHDTFIASYRDYFLERWGTDLKKRVLPNMLKSLGSIKKFESEHNAYDNRLWQEIETLKLAVFKDNENKKSLRTNLVEALDKKRWQEASRSFLELREKGQFIAETYGTYRQNFV